MAQKKKTTKTSAKKKTGKKTEPVSAQKSFFGEEILIIFFFLFSLLLFLSNFGLIGKFGALLKTIQLGLFGALGYVFPVMLFITAIFCLSNKGSRRAVLKIAAAFIAAIGIAGIVHVFFGNLLSDMSRAGELYKAGNAGGFLGGIVASLLNAVVRKVGTILILLAVVIICLVYVTEKSFVSAVRKGSKLAYDKAEEQRRKRDKARVEGIDFSATDLSASDTLASTNGIDIPKYEIKTDDSYSTPEDDLETPGGKSYAGLGDAVSFDGRVINSESSLYDYDVDSVPFDDSHEFVPDSASVSEQPYYSDDDVDSLEIPETEIEEIINTADENDPKQSSSRHTVSKKKAQKTYRIPPISLLERGTRSGINPEKGCRDTSEKLEETLRIFGVDVKVTDISVGPSVTRYELHPEQGVKVSDIVSLQNDIKLALAAPSIRIEAPIPGKAAVGIEIPNSQNSLVCIRDILEDAEYKTSGAKLAFGLGKDIAGRTVVTDIAKMPHLLIAGATGSGKSVCINTLILSILYKYSPDEVKLILIDPKVVELSVYNGIPHLLIPVVNDPKKASGALHWAVNEMMDRYKKFEAVGVRDIRGYNAKIDSLTSSDVAEEVPEKLPLVCIIIDELADLMMVAKTEVEEAICRIAQLARAAGIHLVIATQRPSVNVITGLIKANIPSRIAFAVSSGVDSRTILDRIGAEKLLGKGDMLFNPQGAPEPVRIQGAFVSDSEIQKVTDYIKKQYAGLTYDNESFEQMTLQSVGLDVPGPGNERDELFVQAGRYIIDKEKASIGVLQRAFRIGFNRAARIMDQLADAGVVGPEQGTKPREILMTEEQFETLLKN